MTTLIPKYDQGSASAVNRPFNKKLQESVSILDFGGDPTGSSDSSAAFNAAVAASSHIYFPAGTYKFSSTLTINNINGLVLEGAAAALISAGTTYSTNTVFSFDSAASGSNGLVISNFVGVVVKNIVITQNHSGAGGGSALVMSGGHDFTLENIKVSSQTGSTGKGIVLGGGTGATSTFTGRINNCKVIMASGGSGIQSNDTNTSLTFDSCYVIGGHYDFSGTVYSTVINCACDTSDLYGYGIVGCAGMTFTSCGAEQCQQTMFYLSQGTNNITFTSPLGLANNQSGNTSQGDLFTFDSSGGAIQGITITNPSAVNSVSATVANIYGTASSGVVDVYGVISSKLPKGFGGNTTWLQNKLTYTGDTENISFSPTLDSNWTLVGTPTITAYYNKKGKQIYVSIVITPATSIKANAGAKINLPWSEISPSGAWVIDESNTPYGTAAIFNSEIYLQTTGTLTVPLTVSGTFLIP